MAALEDLLRHSTLWRAREPHGSAQPTGLPTGFAALDHSLPGNGWPRKGLIEILADQHGIGELSLLIPALAALCAEPGGGWLAWVAPPYQPYAPALAASRIDLQRVLIVRAQPAIWAMEQALYSGACSAVLGWATAREAKNLRRLQLAAEQSQALAVLFRRLSDRSAPSPAVLRLALEVDRRGLTVQIIKSRGARPVSVPLGCLAGIAPDADASFT